MLLCLDGVLGADALGELRAGLGALPWAAGLSAGPQALQVKHNLQVPEDAPGLRELRVVVMRALNRSPELMSAALPLKVLPPNFNRYTPQHPSYGWHGDSTLRWLPDGSCLRTDLSATLFLSEPAEYEGGELEIEDTYGTRDIKLPAGSLVLYPSGSVHRVRPVVRGERLACYLFIQSVVKDAGQRRLLYQMDLALRRLRARLGEGDAELVRLTATYNELLRHWGEA